MERAEDLLYVGLHGHVAAIDKRSGVEAWRTSLPDTGYDVVTLLHEDGLLFAVSKGHLFALDAESGRVLWRNRLKGLGHGYALLATTRSATNDSVIFRAAQAAAAAAGSAGGAGAG